MKKLALLMLFVPTCLLGQVIGDFEQWDSLYTMIYQVPAQNPMRGYPLGWKTDNFLSGGAARIEDGYNNYGVVLYTFYHYVPGRLVYIDRNPRYFEAIQGYYKYELGDADYATAERYVQLTAWANGDTVGSSQLQFDTTSTYQQFTLPFSFPLGDDFPDSIQVVFHTNGLLGVNPTNGYLYLDEVEMTTSVLADDQILEKNVLQVSPNPVQDSFTLKTTMKHTPFHCQLFGLDGRLIQSFTWEGPEIRVESHDLEAGIYLLKVIFEEYTQTLKLVKN
ncbi:MAG: T9SS type A sorting domain-containing protein [Bacteroidota bacterium]